jgi:hypothetical protein
MIRPYRWDVAAANRFGSTIRTRRPGPWRPWPTAVAARSCIVTVSADTRGCKGVRGVDS